MRFSSPRRARPFFRHSILISGSVADRASQKRAIPNARARVKRRVNRRPVRCSSVSSRGSSSQEYDTAASMVRRPSLAASIYASFCMEFFNLSRARKMPIRQSAHCLDVVLNRHVGGQTWMSEYRFCVGIVNK